MAVQIIGEEISNKSENINIIPSKCKTSQFDDLAFEMYVDTEITEILKQMEEKKHNAAAGKITYVQFYIFLYDCKIYIKIFGFL